MEKKDNAYEIGGKVDPENGVAEFPVLVDRRGKLTVPGYVRRSLKMENQGCMVQCKIQIIRRENRK